MWRVLARCVAHTAPRTGAAMTAMACGRPRGSGSSIATHTRACSNRSGDNDDDTRRACARDRVSQMMSYASDASSTSSTSDTLSRSVVDHSNRSAGGDGSSRADFFDGRFDAGSPFIDSAALAAMQAKLRESMTPEMRAQMSAMVQSAMRDGSDVDTLRRAAAALRAGGGDGGGMVGMMAFGLGENERGKKVARAAAMAYDTQSGQVHKDFVEQQLEPDDVCLPRNAPDEVGDTLEVEFVDDDHATHSSNSHGDDNDGNRGNDEGNTTSTTRASK